MHAIAHTLNPPPAAARTSRRCSAASWCCPPGSPWSPRSPQCSWWQLGTAAPARGGGVWARPLGLSSTLRGRGPPCTQHPAVGAAAATPRPCLEAQVAVDGAVGEGGGGVAGGEGCLEGRSKGGGGHVCQRRVCLARQVLAGDRPAALHRREGSAVGGGGCSRSTVSGSRAVSRASCRAGPPVPSTRPGPRAAPGRGPGRRRRRGWRLWRRPRQPHTDP